MCALKRAPSLRLVSKMLEATQFEQNDGPIPERRGMPVISSQRPSTYAVTRRFIQDRTARVGVVGLGRIGLPMAMRLSHAGFAVQGFDFDSAKTNRLRIRKHYLWQIAPEQIRNSRQGELDVTGDLSHIAETEVLVLCLPILHSQPLASDLQLVRESIFAVATYIHAGHLVIVESPIDPVITEEVVVPILESANGAHLKVSRDTGSPDEIFVGISPRGEGEDNSSARSMEAARLVGGADRLGMELTLELYSNIFKKVIPVPCPPRAEVFKLVEWARRCSAPGGALTNKLHGLWLQVCDAELFVSPPGAFRDPHDWTKGMDFPIDPFYVAWKEAESGFCFRPVE